MAQQINIPGQGLVNFPDGMSDDQITAAIHSNFGTPAQATPEQEAIGSRAGRFVTGALEPIMGIGQLAPRAVSEIASLGGHYPNAVSEAADKSAARQDAGAHQLEATYDDARKATGQSGFDWMKLGGNLLSPANAVIGTGAGALPEAAGFMGRVAQGAGVGAAYGAAAPVDTAKGEYGSQKAGQMETGAAFGAAAPVIGEAVSRVMYPRVGDSQRLLLDEGVRLTPGQIGGGAWKTTEDKLTSVPLLGDLIKGAQNRSVEDLNTAVANRALEPIGKELPGGLSGRDAVGYVKKTLGDAYDNLLPKMTGQADTQFVQDLGQIKTMISALPDQEQKSFGAIIARELESRFSPNGSITGDSVKEVESALSREVKNFSASPDAYQRQLADALKETQGAVRSMLGRVNPGHADELQAINQGYSNYARMRSAASMLGANEGTFTPAQLANAVKAADKTVGKGGYATGSAPMQDLSDAAKSVLPQKYQDSGSIGRLLMAALLGKELGGGAVVASHPVAAGAIGAAGAMYTRPGQAAARLLMSQRPDAFKPVAGAIAKYSNPADLARLLTGQ